MHRHLFITFVLLTGCATEMPSYEQAVAQSKAQADVAHFKEWSKRVVEPFVERNLPPAISQCAQFVPGATSATAHLVIDVAGSAPPTRIAVQAPTPFSDCVRAHLQSLEWPRAPSAIRFLPIEVNLHDPDPEGSAADGAITSVTPSNTSFERMRER